jgi:dolichol-phosphate mannosyltransferase
MLISIIVPVYNSYSILPKLLEAIEDEKRKNNWNLELILIEDGSTDNSFEKIQELSKLYSYIKGYQHARNFGHQAAVRLGLSVCEGDYIAIIDDDLQDPPSLLPNFFSYLDNGYSVAYGVRRKRKENIIKRIAYFLFYRLLKNMSNIDIPLDTGDFCVMKKEVAEKMMLLNEQNPFLRGIRAWVGFKQIGVEYERNSRLIGDSGYTLKKLFKISIDAIFSFSILPVRLISTMGFLGLLGSILFVINILIQYYYNEIPVRGYSSQIILISFFGSLTLICLGIIGEYVVRIYNEVKQRPHSVVAQTVNV